MTLGMLRLRPTVVSLTMAEVKEVERRRLFKKHLEQTMNIDKYHWRRKVDEIQFDELPRELATSVAAGQASTVRASSDDKGATGVTSQVSEGVPQPSSPATSVSSINNEIIDGEFLPRPSRSRRLESRHHVSTEAEERRARQEARISGVQTRSRTATARLDLQTDGPASLAAEQSSGPNLRASTRSPRDPPNNWRAGFSDRGQTQEHGAPDLSLMINDEPSPWPSTPISPEASSSRLRAFDRVPASRTQAPNDDGREVSQGLSSGYRERRADAHHSNSTPRPSSAGSPSSPSLPITPSRLQIYNDSLPASSQPQTPQNLPEARHRSRLREAWTAPARVSSPHVTPFRTPTTTRVRRRRGLPSPPGLQAPRGFMGLYGGTENIDDSVLFEESSRALGSGDP